MPLRQVFVPWATAHHVPPPKCAIHSAVSFDEQDFSHIIIIIIITTTKKKVDLKDKIIIIICAINIIILIIIKGINIKNIIICVININISIIVQSINIKNIIICGIKIIIFVIIESINIKNSIICGTIFFLLNHFFNIKCIPTKRQPHPPSLFLQLSVARPDLSLHYPNP